MHGLFEVPAAPPDRREEIARRFATVVGIAVLTVFVIFGLAAIGFVILLVVGFSNYGSNK
jgi:hypothetical protein